MSAPGAEPVVVPDDNGAIRQLRTHVANLEEQLKNEKTARTSAEEKATTLEREKLSEMERLQANLTDRDRELGDLRPLKDTHARFESKFKALYESEWNAIPEEHRSKAEPLLSGGDWAEKYEKLLAFKTFLPAEQGKKAGSVTNPGTPGQPSPEVRKPAEPQTAEDIKGKSWGDMPWKGVPDRKMA